MLQDFLMQKFQEIWDELKADFVTHDISQLIEALVDYRLYVCSLDNRDPMPDRQTVLDYYNNLWASYTQEVNSWPDGF